MRSSKLLQFAILFLISTVVMADTPLIRTTVADSSNVSFIARTHLSWETVEHDSLRYTRFTESPLIDSVGFPELPMITCLVAVPDSVTPHIEFTFSDDVTESIQPVYPVPASILKTDSCTPMLVDSFVQDSTAYTSSSFWPSERVRLIGQTRICDQRLLQIQLFPAQYRASDSTLSTVTSFSVSVSYDSSEAVWSSIGLGMFQEMIEGSPIVGYNPMDRTHAPVPEYLGKVNPWAGPASPDNRMPDYLIICASGLFDQCEEAIEDLAEHRVSLNGFDVATVVTDEILFYFKNPGQEVITDETIRDFTEHMCENWPQASVKIPDYILLIGDHEVTDYGAEDWFLPTHIYDDYIGSLLIEDIGNDEWYAYMNGDSDINNDFPSMVVGRLSVKNGSTAQTDTLSTMIENIIALEQPIVNAPLTDNRRRILRLAGTGNDDAADTFLQAYQSWGPSRLWTGEFSDWLGYNYNSYYCGDGRNFSSSDGSLLSSGDFRDACIDELKTGAGVAFYTNHGEFHMFSAGLEWCPRYYTAGDDTKGCRDSTFNNYQIENQLTSTNQYYSAPFLLMLCCSAGTFNHTEDDHRRRTSHQYFCHWEESPICDFGTDCLAEKMLKNTAVPVAGVFASSMPSGISSYPVYGEGILKGIYSRGFGRVGDAIAYARSSNQDYFMMGTGGYQVSSGQFNLLGDPALDISDRVRYPNTCDLVLYADDISIGYPVETANGFDLPVSFTVHNNGRLSSGSYSTRLVFSSGQSVEIKTVACSAIPGRAEDIISYTWQCTNGFTPPRALNVSIEVDYLSACTDSWRANNSAEISYQLNDVYPIDSGWPIISEGIVQTTPILANLDLDQNLEVVTLAGPNLTAYNVGQTVTKLWRIDGEDFSGTRQPLAADLDQDGETELLLSSGNNEITVVSNEGSVLYTLTGASDVFAVGELYSRTGLELCTASDDGRYLKLYYWENNSMNLIATKDLGYTGIRSPVSLVVAGISGSTYSDAVYLNGGIDGFSPEQEKTSIEVYNWGTSILEFSETWNEYVNGSIRLSAGMLSEIGSVGYPQGVFDTSGDPALIIEPDEASPEILCAKADVLSAARLNLGVFADWAEFPAGPDAFVLPSERQCMAWDVDGLAFGIDIFPTDEFSGASEGSALSPTALGNLNGTGDDDVLFSTLLDGDWALLAYDSDGDPLNTTLDFPYTLPEGVTATGGFAIGDLDRDSKVEIVFGTDDGLLHCWEFGSCSTGYAPWTQFQHDSGRSGVLE